MSANSCFGVMMGFGANEKTIVNLAAWLSAFKIGFTLLVSFFITHIGYMSLRY